MLWMWNDDPHPQKIWLVQMMHFLFILNGPFLGGHVNLFWGGDVSIKGSMVKIS